jgi:phosphoribosylglycinamide formyltransferase-1
MVVLVSGYGTNLMAIQEAVEAGWLDGRIMAVISNKKDAHALDYAREKGLPAMWLDPKEAGGRTAYEARLLGRIGEAGADCLVLAGYMLLLSGEFIHRFGKPILNIHPSLLPSFPGTTAQKDAVAYGVKYSGCTIHFVDEGMDSGPIIAQAVAPVLETDDEQSLAARILVEEHKLYPRVLALLAQGKIRREGRKVCIDR